VRSDSIHEVPLSQERTWIYGAASVTHDRALLGGTRGNVLLWNASQSSMRSLHLRDFGVPRPGRDILNVVSRGTSPLLLGKKGLLVEYRDDVLVDLGCPAASAADVFLYNAAVMGDSIWMTGMRGLFPVLCEYSLDDRTLQYYQCPAPPNRCPAITVADEQIVLATDEILVGLPGRWRSVMVFERNAVIGVFPRPFGGPQEFVAVAFTGEVTTFSVS